jgi:hypothetical protein
VENPLRWGKVRHAINHAIEKQRLDAEQGIRGTSLVTVIYNELEARGFVVADEPENGTDNPAGDASVN